MQIKIESNFEDVRRQFAHMAKQVNFAGAVALTKTAKDVQAALPAALERDLDNPVPFTKRGSTFVIPARRDTLAATVQFKDRQARYMALQISGGVRRPGAAGIKLPGGIKLNAFGNIPRGTIAQLKAVAKSGQLSQAVARRIQAEGAFTKRGSAKMTLFYGKPTGAGWDDAPSGIWLRIPPTGTGYKKGKLVPVIVFEKKAAVYKKKFDFVELARKTADLKFGAHFDAAFANALRTAR
jgi:hypothetical protein